MNWLHRLFNPHCEHCLAERFNPEVEYLKAELSKLQDKYDLLVRGLLTPVKTEPIKEEEPKEYKPISRGYVSLAQRRHLLEQADKEKLDAIRRKNEQTEKDLGLVSQSNG